MLCILCNQIEDDILTKTVGLLMQNEKSIRFSFINAEYSIYNLIKNSWPVQLGQLLEQICLLYIRVYRKSLKSLLMDQS